MEIKDMDTQEIYAWLITINDECYRNKLREELVIREEKLKKKI